MTESSRLIIPTNPYVQHELVEMEERKAYESKVTCIVAQVGLALLAIGIALANVGHTSTDAAYSKVATGMLASGICISIAGTALLIAALYRAHKHRDQTPFTKERVLLYLVVLGSLIALGGLTTALGGNGVHSGDLVKMGLGLFVGGAALAIVALKLFRKATEQQKEPTLEEVPEVR